MSESWAKTTLGEICAINLGQSPSSDTYNQEKIGLPFFQGKSEFGSKYAQATIWCSEPQKIADKGDILISVRAPVGESNLAPEECCIGRGLASLRASQICLDQEFLWHYIESRKIDLQGIAQGSTFDAISGNDLDKMIVQTPPLPEQKKIAEILSGIDKLIGIHSAGKQKMSNLLVAMREKIFANENSKEISLGELCIPKQWQTISANQITKTGYPVYGANGQIGFYSEYNHKDPVLAVTCRGATCGNLNLIPGFSYVTGNSMCLDNLSKDISIQYLYHFLAWRKLNDVISGSAQPQITRTPLQAVQIMLPTKQRQNEMVSMLAAIATSHDHEREVIARLENLKKAVSSDLLSGRKRVTI